MMRVTCRLAIIALIATGAGCSESADQPWALRVEPMRSPAGEASAQPQLTVSEHGAILSWLENVGTASILKFAERNPTGWSDARQVVSGDGFFANWADVPSEQDGSASERQTFRRRID